MTVPFYNFTELHNDEFKSAIKERFSKIIDDGAFVEGEYNASFEQKFAKLQAAKHCLLVANGTDALEICLEVLGVGPGDFVGVPGITFYATSEAVLNRGATPVFVDVIPESGLMCPQSLERVLSKHKLKAIMPVHIYGLPAPIRELEAVCKKHNVAIVEDAAQAQGTFLENGPVGSSNNMTTFSFYPTKNLSAFGDAGAILCQSDEQAERIKHIRNHGRGGLPIFGRNSRCDHLQAAVLDMKLEKIDGYNQARKKIASLYHEALKDFPVRVLPSRFIETSSWHLYPIGLASKEQRARVEAHLKAKNIGCTPFYERSQSEEPALKNYAQLGEDENARAFAGTIICLPIHPFVSQEDVATVAAALKEIL